MVEDKFDKRELGFLRGQALNLAWEEAIEVYEKKVDLDKVFERAKEIYHKAIQVGYLKWEPKKEIKDIKLSTEDIKIDKMPKGNLKHERMKRIEIRQEAELKKKGKELRPLEYYDQFEYKDGKWIGCDEELKKCPWCKEEVPSGMVMHEKKKNGVVCGYAWDPRWYPPSPHKDYRVCRRCGDSVPWGWPEHSYKRDGSKCGYKFKENEDTKKSK